MERWAMALRVRFRSSSAAGQRISRSSQRLAAICSWSERVATLCVAIELRARPPHGKPRPIDTLEFERPIVELERQIDELKKMAGDQQLHVSDEIAPLERSSTELRTEIYRNLTPFQRVQVARSSRRPFTLDYIRLAFTDFIELHGDRALPG